MPALSSPSTWRLHPARQTYYAYIHDPAVIFQANVATSSFTYPVVQLPFDGVSIGAYTDVSPGMTVRIETSGGTFKNYATVRKAPTSNTLYLIPVGRVDLTFADNDIIKVLDDFRLYSKIPRITSDGTQYKNWDVAWSSAAAAEPPVANAGGWVAKRITSGSTITVEFSGSGSYAVANGASISTYLWDVGDGTITVGTSASAGITATFPVGGRWVSLTVTDSNGQTHTTRVLVAAVTDASAKRVNIARIGGAAEEGWQVSLGLLESDNSDYIPGAPVIVWAEETYNTTAGSLNGDTDRKHIKFTGWAVDDLTLVEPVQSEYTINAANGPALLRLLPAFPQTQERIASPASWFESPYLTHWRFFHYLAYWHSSLFEVCSVERPAHYATFPVVRLDADAGTLFDQFAFMARAVRARFTTSAAGLYYMRYNPHLMTDAERTSLTTIVALTDTDWHEQISIPARHRPAAAALQASGIVASADTVSAVLAAAPDTAAGQGAAQEQLDRQLVVDQADLNSRAARYFARLNAAVTELTMLILNPGQVADPGWQEKITLTLAASSNSRGVSYSGAGFILRSVEVSYDAAAGVSTETWILEPLESISGTAVSVQLPGAAAPDGDYISDDGTFTEQFPLSWEFVYPRLYTPNMAATSYDVAGAVIAFNADVVLTDDGSAASPDWSVELAATTVYDAAQDDTSSGYGVYVLTEGGVYYSANILTTAPTLKQAATDTPVILRAMAGQAGAVCWIEYSVTAGAWTEQLDFTSEAHWFHPVTGYYGGVAGYPALTEYEAGVGFKHVDFYNNTTYLRGSYIQAYFGACTLTDLNMTCTITVLGNDSGNMRAYDATASDYFNSAYYEYFSSTTLTASWDGTTSTKTNRTAIIVSAYVDSDNNPANLVGSLTYTNLEVKGTGYNPFSDSATLYVSSDNGVTVDAAIDLGRWSGDNGNPYGWGLDTDDFGLGVIMVGTDRGVYYSATYGGALSRIADGDLGMYPNDGQRPLESIGLALGYSNVPLNVSLIRVPYLKQNGALNNSKTALEFVFAFYWPYDLYAAGGWGVRYGAMQRATLNANTGAISSLTNITPYIGGLYYYPTKHPNNVEIYGGDAQKMLGWFIRGDGASSSNDVALLGTVDGGANWTIKQAKGAYAGSWVRFVEPTQGGNGSKVWLGGVSGGIWYSSDFGATLTSKAGDIATETGLSYARGAFALG